MDKNHVQALPLAIHHPQKLCDITARNLIKRPIELQLFGFVIISCFLLRRYIVTLHNQ